MFLFKVKSHRGEPTHEEADIQEDKAISNKDVPMERCNSREQAFWQKSGNDRAFGKNLGMIGHFFWLGA